MATQSYIFAPKVCDNRASGAGGNNVGVADLLTETIFCAAGWSMSYGLSVGPYCHYCFGA